MATQVAVEPVHSDDWEILECNAGYLEEQFLNQARIVANGAVLSLWLHNQISVNMKIVSIDPAGHEFYGLDTQSEIVVAPKQRARPAKVVDGTDHKRAAAMESFMARLYLDEWTACALGDCEIGIASSPEFASLQDALVYVQNVDFEQIAPAVVESDPPSDRLRPRVRGTFCRIRLVADSLQLHGHAVVPGAVAAKIGATAGSRLRVSQINQAAASLSPSVIFRTAVNDIPASKLGLDVKAQLANLLRQQQWLVVHDDLVLSAHPCPGSFVIPKPEQQAQTAAKLFDTPAFLLLDQTALDQLDIQIQVKPHLVLPPVLAIDGAAIALPGFDSEIDQTASYLSSCRTIKTRLRLGTPSPGGLLIHGGPGSGKSSLIRYLKHHAEKELQLYVMSWSCDDLKAASIAKLKTEFSRLKSKAIWHQPCLVVFEDLDSMIGGTDE
ncbi:Peroxisome biosynthesis protein pex1, partial [Kappamyces sp. JEL0680]